MANITRIKAQDKKKKTTDDAPKTKVTNDEKAHESKALVSHPKEKKLAKIFGKKKHGRKANAEAKKDKKLGYFRGAWLELGQVRWPSRKETWKMTFSVVIYVIIFAVAILILDTLFKLIFKTVIGG